MLLAKLGNLVDAARLGAMRDALASLLDLELFVTAGPVGVVAAGQLSGALSPTLVALALERPGARVAIELEPSVGLAVVDRVLGGEGVAPPGPALLSATEQGVLAFVGARAAQGSGFALVDVVTTREGLAAWLGEDACAWWSLGVSLGARASGARLWTPARTLDGATPTRHALPRAISDVGIHLRVRVGRARLPSAEVAALDAGDVILPDELLAERGPEGPRWSEARLASRGGEVAVELSREGEAWCVRAVRGARRAESVTIVEDVMSEAEAVRTDELSEVAEVPVELAIELGRLELRVRELAALVPGRVISARIPVGREVELRAGDRVVASGELVDIDGELGVRITSLRR
jgi:type III secretion system YscQ/HrcQ family protein